MQCKNSEKEDALPRTGWDFNPESLELNRQAPTSRATTRLTTEWQTELGEHAQRKLTEQSAKPYTDGLNFFSLQALRTGQLQRPWPQLWFTGDLPAQLYS